MIAVVAVAIVIALMALAIGPAGFDPALILALRGPRVLAAAGVGALLALSGLSLQVLLRNPLADPYVLGTSGGAAAGALLALMVGSGIWLGAGMGALASTAVLLLIARRALASDEDAGTRLILTGAMLAALFGAVATLLLTITPDQRLRGAIFWLVGDLSGADLGPECLIAALGFGMFLVIRERAVERLMLGAELAMLLGEPVRRLRLQLLLAAATAAALAVVAAGAIGFVGLVVPHALRLAGIHRIRHLAVAAGFAGAALLIAADLIARTLVSPLELPVGALMALIGAPGLMLLLGRDAT